MSAVRAYRETAGAALTSRRVKKPHSIGLFIWGYGALRGYKSSRRPFKTDVTVRS
jgi:hypothetical protein